MATTQSTRGERSNAFRRLDAKHETRDAACTEKVEQTNYLRSKTNPGLTRRISDSRDTCLHTQLIREVFSGLRRFVRERQTVGTNGLEAWTILVALLETAGRARQPAVPVTGSVVRVVESSVESASSVVQSASSVVQPATSSVQAPLRSCNLRRVRATCNVSRATCDFVLSGTKAVLTAAFLACSPLTNACNELIFSSSSFGAYESMPESRAK